MHEIEVKNFAGIGHKHVGVDNVNKGFLHNGGSQAGHVDSIDIVPKALLLVLVLAVLDGSDEDLGTIWEHLASFVEVLVASPKHTIKHRLIKQEVTHPLRDNDVDFLNGEHNFLHLALEHGDLVLKTILLDDFPCKNCNLSVLDGVDVFSSSSGSENTEDASSTANIEHNLILEILGIILDGALVGPRAHAVLEHLLVDVEA